MADDQPEPHRTTRATRRDWAALAVLTLPTLVISSAFSVLYVALPALSADLKLSSTQLLWLTDIYGFTIAGFLITMGSLGDRLGRRRSWCGAERRLQFCRWWRHTPRPRPC